MVSRRPRRWPIDAGGYMREGTGGGRLMGTGGGGSMSADEERLTGTGGRGLMGTGGGRSMGTGEGRLSRAGGGRLMGIRLRPLQRSRHFRLSWHESPVAPPR